jgi:hypothetical protein
MTGWPTIGTNLAVRLGCCGGLPHRSQVLRSQGDLVVAAPSEHPGFASPPNRGDRLTLGWAGPTAWLELDATFVDHEAPGGWRVAAPQQVRRVQRREFARCREARHAVLALRPDGRTLDATVIDLGEGGIRAILPPPGPIVVGSEIDVGVDLDGTWILLAAEVVRATARPAGLAELGLRFTHLERRLADTIRRHVFARQARERALGVAPA